MQIKFETCFFVATLAFKLPFVSFYIVLIFSEQETILSFSQIYWYRCYGHNNRHLLCKIINHIIFKIYPLILLTNIPQVKMENTIKDTFRHLDTNMKCPYLYLPFSPGTQQSKSMSNNSLKCVVALILTCKDI